MAQKKYVSNYKTYPEEVEEAFVEETEEVSTPVEPQPEYLAPTTVQPTKEVKMTTETVTVPPFATSIKEYTRIMGVGAVITSAEGGKEQYKLWTTIKSIVTHSESQAVFNSHWNYLLGMIKEGRDTVFSEGMVYRFPESWAGSTTEFTIYRRIMHVIIATCDPTVRSKSLKYVNLNMALSEGLTEAEKNKIINFYQ